MAGPASSDAVKDEAPLPESESLAAGEGAGGDVRGEADAAAKPEGAPSAEGDGGAAAAPEGVEGGVAAGAPADAAEGEGAKDAAAAAAGPAADATTPAAAEQPAAAAVPDVDCDDGIPYAELEAFLTELRTFLRARGKDFRIPRFYGTSVNLLKLWRLVCFHGGYDKVTSGKLWRAVGDHFNPPRSCTTLSWSFRGFYEKSLLDYERHHGVPSIDELGTLPLSLKQRLESRGKDQRGSDAGNGYLCGLPPPSSRQEEEKKEDGAEGDGVAGKKRGSEGLEFARTPETGAKKGRKHHAEGSPKTPLMGEGWPSDHRLVARPADVALGQDEFGGQGKGRPRRASAPGLSRDIPQQPAVVWDVGEECPWVRINVRRSADCFEIYALVPGLLREEIKVQVEGPARVVIAGTPENEDNPWGVRRFKKIVVLPGSVVPAETSAVVALHGQLYIHLPLAPDQPPTQPGEAKPATTPSAAPAAPAAAGTPSPAPQAPA